MSFIVDKQGILCDDYEEVNNIQWEEEIYQQMNLIKLEDLNILLLEEIRRKLNKNEKMVVGEENNEIEEELNIDKIESNLVNNVIVKYEEFGESSRRNTHLWGLDIFLQDVP